MFPPLVHNGAPRLELVTYFGTVLETLGHGSSWRKVTGVLGVSSPGVIPVSQCFLH